MPCMGVEDEEVASEKRGLKNVCGCVSDMSFSRVMSDTVGKGGSKM